LNHNVLQCAIIVQHIKNFSRRGDEITTERAWKL